MTKVGPKCGDTTTLNSPGKILSPVRPGFPFRLDRISFSVRPLFPSTMFRVHYILGLWTHRHRAEKICTTWPLSRNPFAPLVWGSKSREWVEANVSNSKSNQKFAYQIKCKNRWKQEFILVFPTHCTQRQFFSRLWVSLSYNAYRQSRA